tara:strand:+ start:201 stop:1091 length:891 start_codon:yes stop_codon:yes gene_type:complete
MGLLRKVRRFVKKIIPKEIRPALPFIAAAIPFAAPAGLGALGAKGAMGSFLRAGITKGLSDDEADVGDILRTASIAAAPQAISKGLGTLGKTLNPNQALTSDLVRDTGKSLSQEIGQGLTSLSTKIPTPEISQGMSLGDVGTQAKLIGTQTAVDVIQDQIKLQEELLDDQGITDKSDRRQQLFDYFTKIEYGDEDEINGLLDRYGYKGFAGGGIATLRPMYAEGGGIMDLGGNEMDLRVGGFVPIGKKEKADDVPARLSKNEFVMTADAVRGAGGGNINVGAKRMYDMMNQYEMMA